MQAGRLVEMLDVTIPVVAKLKVSVRNVTSLSGVTIPAICSIHHSM